MKTVKISLQLLFNSKFLSNREAVRIIFASIQRKNINLVDLDFDKIEFVSRSFADELILSKENLEKDKAQVDFINLNQEIEKMLSTVSESRRHPKKIKVKPRKVELVDLSPQAF